MGELNRFFFRTSKFFHSELSYGEQQKNYSMGLRILSQHFFTDTLIATQQVVRTLSCSNGCRDDFQLNLILFFFNFSEPPLFVNSFDTFHNFTLFHDTKRLSSIFHVKFSPCTVRAIDCRLNCSTQWDYLHKYAIIFLLVVEICFQQDFCEISFCSTERDLFSPLFLESS